MTTDQLDPVVAKFVEALNAGDSNELLGLLTPNATMSDDGVDRDPDSWLQSEAFGSDGRMDVESIADGGTALVANFTNDRWGAMRTFWRFTVSGDKISRFETGQA
ncbi:hypothetical protein C3486_32235 [Streptomyces sp. Ru73]|nr:nuclear transport factor 2 family protein [Streptomyces sp. Ru73]POX36681.1 hypothetical protein C3486_32235 [Streptomyces sp. Ru73]